MRHLENPELLVTKNNYCSFWHLNFKTSIFKKIYICCILQNNCAAWALTAELKPAWKHYQSSNNLKVPTYLRICVICSFKIILS